MKKLVIVIVLVGAAVFAWKQWGGGMIGPEADAKLRVAAMLEGLKKGGGGVNVDAQTAICQWKRGVILISDQAELSVASDKFGVWAREKGIDRKIADYEVTGATFEEGSRPKTCIVDVKIEGKPYRMRVPVGEPISWAK